MEINECEGGKDTEVSEDKAVPDAAADDIDMDVVKEYTDKNNYGKRPLEYLKEKMVHIF